MGQFILACLVVSGCGFSPKPATSDDQTDANENPDGGPVIVDATGTPNCKPRWLNGTIHFGSPMRLATIDDPAAFERDPSLSDDELVLYFSSNRAGTVGGTDVWTATRATLDADFGTPQIYAAASSNAGDDKLSTIPSGLAFVVASTRTPTQGGGSDIWIATRPTALATFSAPIQTHLQNVNTAADQRDPALSHDELQLYFSLGAGAGSQQIAFATRATKTTDFLAATIITELDSGTGDADPMIAFNERMILFTSFRTGGPGATDIWYATRASGSGTFGTPHLVPDINTTAGDGDPFVSSDGCRFYYASNSLGNDYTLYVATAIP